MAVTNEAEAMGHTVTGKNTNDMNEDEPQTLVLPPEMWANVIECLPFETILSCGATCRTMLHAMPLLKKLCIDKSSQMNLAVAGRFRDIREIHINSLLKVTFDDQGYTDMDIDMETKLRVVPFLIRFASTLECVHFGQKNVENGKTIEGYASVDVYVWEGDAGYPNEGPRDRMLACLDLLSGAFSIGALPTQLKISGLCCPDASGNHGRRNNCETCLRACKTFPLQSVVEFECRGSSSSNGRSGRMHGLDVCLERAQIESIIESRPGGKQLLCSEDRLLRLLGGGRRYNIAANAGGGGKALHIVKHKQEQLDEIKRVIAYAEIDVKSLSMQTISNAIMRSFATNENDLIPPKCQRYFSEASLEYLENKLGLPIDKERFERPLTDLVEHTQQFVWVLNQGEDGTNEEGLEEELYRHKDIELDCLKLIHRFLEVESNPPIDQITNALSYMTTKMAITASTEEQMKYQVEAASCLKSIIERGSDEHREMVVDNGLIDSFSRLLNSTSNCTAKVSLLALSDIATRGTNEYIERIASTSAIPKLIGLLDSDQDDCVESSLMILVVLEAKCHIKQSVHSSLLPHIIRLMMRKIPEQSDILSNCSILLRVIFDVEKPPIQTVMELEAVPRLIEIMKTTEDPLIQTNLEHVMITLLSGSRKQRTALVVEAGFLSVLVYLVGSQDVDIAKKAILAVGHVAIMAPSFCDSLLQAGIILPLLRVLKQATSVDTLKVSTSTFAKCCRGKLDFATSKASLKVLTQLLVNDDKKVVVNSCWALFYILDGLTCEGVNEVMTIGFVDHLLKQLSNASHKLQAPILKSLHLITTAGDASIKAITLRNGIACLSKALDTNFLWLSDSHESNQELACMAISNIISGDKERIQSAIDNNIVPCLAQMLTAKNNKKHALWTIYQITKVGDKAQVTNLVKADFIKHLCELLITDCSTTIMALWTLKNILRVGKENASVYSVLSSGAQEIENKLEELTNENLRLENDIERVDLLQKKKAWLEFYDKSQHLESLKSAPGLLNEQLNNNERRLQSIEKKIASVGEEMPLGKVYIKLQKKERDVKAFILKQICETSEELSEVKATRAQLLNKAEKIAPQEEWNEIRVRNDLPTNLTETCSELKKFRSSVRLLKATRESFERRSSIEEMKGGFESLFKCFDDTETTRKKRKATEDAQDKKKTARAVRPVARTLDKQEGMDIDYDSETTIPIRADFDLKSEDE